MKEKDQDGKTKTLNIMHTNQEIEKLKKIYLVFSGIFRKKEKKRGIYVQEKSENKKDYTI